MRRIISALRCRISMRRKCRNLRSNAPQEEMKCPIRITRTTRARTDRTSRISRTVRTRTVRTDRTSRVRTTDKPRVQAINGRAPLSHLLFSDIYHRCQEKNALCGIAFFPKKLYNVHRTVIPLKSFFRRRSKWQTTKYLSKHLQDTFTLPRRRWRLFSARAHS